MVHRETVIYRINVLTSSSWLKWHSAISSLTSFNARFNCWWQCNGCWKRTDMVRYLKVSFVGCHSETETLAFMKIVTGLSHTKSLKLIMKDFELFVGNLCPIHHISYSCFFFNLIYRSPTLVLYSFNKNRFNDLYGYRVFLTQIFFFYHRLISTCNPSCETVFRTIIEHIIAAQFSVLSDFQPLPGQRIIRSCAFTASVKISIF